MEVINETIMDNNVAEEAMEAVEKAVTNIRSYRGLAVAGGAAAVVALGLVVYNKVIKPARDKRKAMKELEAAKQAEYEDDMFDDVESETTK